MSTETHINQFVREIEDAYDKAVAAVGELKDKIEAFKNKAVSMSPELREALNVAEGAAGELEQKTEENNTKDAGGGKASGSNEKAKS